MPKTETKKLLLDLADDYESGQLLWQQGRYYTPPNGLPLPCACVIGGLILKAGEIPPQPNEEFRPEVLPRIVLDAIGLLATSLKDPVSWKLSVVVSWNDALAGHGDQRTVYEVIKKLRETAAA